MLGFLRVDDVVVDNLLGHVLYAGAPVVRLLWPSSRGDKVDAGHRDEEHCQCDRQRPLPRVPWDWRRRLLNELDEGVRHIILETHFRTGSSEQRAGFPHAPHLELRFGIVDEHLLDRAGLSRSSSPST